MLILSPFCKVIQAEEFPSQYSPFNPEIFFLELAQILCGKGYKIDNSRNLFPFRFTQYSPSSLDKFSWVSSTGQEKSGLYARNINPFI